MVVPTQLYHKTGPELKFLTLLSINCEVWPIFKYTQHTYIETELVDQHLNIYSNISCFSGIRLARFICTVHITGSFSIISKKYRAGGPEHCLQGNPITMLVFKALIMRFLYIKCTLHLENHDRYWVCPRPSFCVKYDRHVCGGLPRTHNHCHSLLVTLTFIGFWALQYAKVAETQPIYEHSWPSLQSKKLRVHLNVELRLSFCYVVCSWEYEELLVLPAT